MLLLIIGKLYSTLYNLNRIGLLKRNIHLCELFLIKLERSSTYCNGKLPQDSLLLL